VRAALGLLEEGLEEEVEVAAGAAGVEEGLAGALAVLGELGGLAEVAADEGGVEAAARGGREAEGGRDGGRRPRGARGLGGRGERRARGGRRGGVHGGGLLYAGSGRPDVCGAAGGLRRGCFFLKIFFLRKVLGARADAGARERGFGRAGQRLRRLCGRRYLGWFVHGIFGESRDWGGGEACARAGVSGVRVAGAGTVDLLTAGVCVVSRGYIGWDY